MSNVSSVQRLLVSALIPNNAQATRLACIHDGLPHVCVHAPPSEGCAHAPLLPRKTFVDRVRSSVGRASGGASRARSSNRACQKTHSLVCKGSVACADHVALAAIQVDLAGGNQHPTGEVGGQGYLSSSPCIAHTKGAQTKMNVAAEHHCPG